MKGYWTARRRWILCLLLALLLIGTAAACATTQTPAGETPAAATSTAPAEPTATPTTEATPTGAAGGGVPDALVGPTWLLRLFGPADRLSSLPAYSRLTAEFAPDGTLTGLGGCNWYSGQVSVEGNTLTVAELEQTQMTNCPPEALEQEQAYLALLQQAESYAIDGDQLEIAAGEERLIYEAQPEPAIWVEITRPEPGAVIDPAAPVVVEGRGQGMFEGTVSVRLLDEESAVLAEQSTIMAGENVGTGGEGIWQVSLAPQVAAGTGARIVALSTSPADGSVVAIDVVAVSFGE